jgi:hypothetical protein
LTGYWGEVALEVGMHRFTSPAVFVEGWRFPYALLGQLGFFDRFRVLFSNGPGQRFLEVLPLGVEEERQP